MALLSLDLFDGFGGFDLAFRYAGLPVQTVCRVERDFHAAATLVERMEEQALDACPIWDDVTTFDGAPWRGHVDLITAGMPCQPHSVAGHMRGIDDDRFIWGSVASIIDAVRPRLLFVENVVNFRDGGLPRMLHDLAQMGFDASWCCLGANAVGAPHPRDRIFILAWTQAIGTLAHADGEHGGLIARATCSGAKDKSLLRLPDHRGFPPLPTDVEAWKQGIERQDLPEPILHLPLDGTTRHVVESIHLGGNGLVPQQAALALREICTFAAPVRFLLDAMGESS